MSVTERRAQLARELIASLKGGAPTSESTVKAFLTAIEYNLFLDCQPHLVEDAYKSLTERLDDDAQFDKAQALNLLRMQFLSTPLPSSQRDPHHRVLSLLCATAGRVLDTRVQPSALLVALAEQAQPQSGDPGPPVHDDDASVDGGWPQHGEPCYSPGDNLSDWSDMDAASERASSPARPHAAHLLATDYTEDAPATPPPPSLHALRSPQRVQQRLAPPPPRRRGNPYGPASLAVWLAAKQSYGHPARILDPRLCFTDGELVEQTLNVLKGISLPGLAFSFDPAADAYHVHPGVHMHTTTAAAAASLLQRFALLGTRLRRLQRFSDGLVLTSAGPCGVDARLRALPTVVAFAAALAAQVQAIRGQLVGLEVEARAGKLSLLTLRLKVSVVEQQVAALHSVVQLCTWQGDGAATAARLLGVLQQAVQRHMLQATSQGGVVAGMLLSMFVAACRPCLDALHAWVERGVLEDPAAEFFIAANAAAAGAAPLQLWGGTHLLRQLADGSAAAPPFLLPLADGALAAGTCALVLRGRCSAAAGASSAFEEPSIHSAFARSLRDVLLQHQADTRGADEPRVASPLKRAPPEGRGLGGNDRDCGTATERCTHTHAALDEWLAATSRGGGSQTMSVQLCEDLPALLRLPASPLDLPASAACPAGTALEGGEVAAGDHGVAEAMRRSAAQRVQQAVAGDRTSLRGGALFCDDEGSGWTLAGAVDDASCGAPALAELPAAALPPPGFEGSGGWGQWFEQMSAKLPVASNRSLAEQPEPETRDAAAWGPEQGAEAVSSRWPGRGSPGGGAAVEPALCNNAPPLDVLLDRCLQAPVQAAVLRAEQRLCETMLGAGLVAQLASLRELHLMAAPPLERFVHSLLMRISTPRGVVGVSQFELNLALQDSLADAQGGLPGIAAASAEVLPLAEGAGGGSADDGGVRGLSRLSLRIQLAWPLCLMADQSLLRQHASLLTLVLQLRWVQQSLHAACAATWKRRSKATAAGAADRAHCVLLHEMLHLVSAVHQHVVSYVAAAARQLDAAVGRSSTLRGMQDSCQLYVAAVDRGCLLGGGGLAQLLLDAVVRVLDTALRYCALSSQVRRLAAAAAGAATEAAEASCESEEDAGTASANRIGRQPPCQPTVGQVQQRRQQLEAALAGVGAEYRQRQRLLVRMLVAKVAAEAGAHVQELRALLAALDLNGFYGSASGEGAGR